MSPSKTIEVIARGLLMHDDLVLLCRAKKGGYCYLPGGHVDPGEPSADACKREILEELGLDVTVGACLLVNELIFNQSGHARHEITTVFHVEHRFETSPNAASPPPLESREDHIEFLWAPIAALVEMDLRPECIRAWLASGGKVTGSALPGAAPTEWLSTRES